MAKSSWTARHWRHVGILALLFLTGAGLFLPSWRSTLGYGLPAVQDLHEIGGICYGVALVGWSARFFPRTPTPRPYVGWALFFLIGLTVTGVGLLVGPSWTHALATVGHAGFAGAFLIWSLWHLGRQIPRRPVPRSAPGLVRINRRRLLRWLMAVSISVPLSVALEPLLNIFPGLLLRAGAGRVPAALPGFVPYTVTNGFPRFHLDTWRLHLTRADGSPVGQWSLPQLQAVPNAAQTITFHCVTGWAVEGVAIRGILLEPFLTHHGWNPATDPWVLFFSGDGVYRESLSAAQIADYQPLLVWEMEGKPLPIAQGYPLRLIVPRMYGYKSIKWLDRIQWGSHDVLGYWEVRGYPENAYLGSYLGL